MEMSEAEIRLSYKYAKRPKQQIRILAQLNACSRSKIEMIIFGKEHFKTRLRGVGDVIINVEAMCEDYRNGAGYAQLSRKYGISVSAAKRMLMDAGEIQYTTRSEMKRKGGKREI